MRGPTSIAVSGWLKGIKKKKKKNGGETEGRKMRKKRNITVLQKADVSNIVEHEL